MNVTKSIRLESAIISELETLAVKKNSDFSKTVTSIISDYVAHKAVKQFIISNYSYYPVHLTNEEFISIINEFSSQIIDTYSCTVKVRKDAGGKGVDFQINLYIEYKNQLIHKKRYAFNINAGWEVENMFEHFYEIANNDSDIKHNNFMCKKVDNISLPIISYIIDENVGRENLPELNPIFNDEKWVTLLEKKYPFLKML